MKADHATAGMKGIQKSHLRDKSFWSRNQLVDFSAKAAELLIASLVVIFLSTPLLVLLALRKLFTGKVICSAAKVYGAGGLPVDLKYFNVSWQPARCLALYPYIFKGDIALVGGAMQSYDVLVTQAEYGYIREMKPGIFSLWQLRKNSRIGHEGFLSTEWEYCFTRTTASDLLLLLRVLPSYLFSSKRAQSTPRISLFDISFLNTSMDKAVQNIDTLLQQGDETRTIYFVNPDCLNKTFSDRQYHSILQQADLVFPDGIGLVIACKMMGTPLEENINGTDLLPYLCRMSVGTGRTIFLLGGRPGVAEKMGETLERRYGVKIAGVHHGYFDHENESRMLVQRINRSGADIVLVAFGAPLQEKWIEANKHHLAAGAAIGVGGLFDFYSGRTRRAPRWLRELGLEWVYRILQEPGRMWRRYVIGNPLFLLRVVLWKVKNGFIKGGANG